MTATSRTYIYSRLTYPLGMSSTMTTRNMAIIVNGVLLLLKIQFQTYEQDL